MRIGFFGDSLTAGVPGSSYVAILRRRFPDHALLNYGRANDTVVSLHRRISAQRFDPTFDLAFLWIGVNDVPRRSSWPYRMLNSLVGQQRARNLDEFLEYFRATLNLLRENAGRVVVVPPALRGEDLQNPWNRRLAALAASINDLTAELERAEFLDLRAVFARELAVRPVSEYLPNNPFHVFLAALTLRTDERIDRKASERGLHFTLDGLHLNSAGAELVAGEFASVIENLSMRA